MVWTQPADADRADMGMKKREELKLSPLTEHVPVVHVCKRRVLSDAAVPTKGRLQRDD